MRPAPIHFALALALLAMLASVLPATAGAQGAGGLGSGPIKAADKQRDEIKKELAPAAKGGDLKAVRRLVEYLLYKHQYPRADAFDALCDVTDEKALDWLAAEPLFHPHWVVRSDIIDVLVHRKHAKALPALVKLLSSEKENRQQLVIAIATLGGKAESATLLKLAKSEKDPRARAEAIQAAVAAAPDEAIALAKAGTLDDDWAVRVGSLRALLAANEEAALEGAAANLRERRTQVEKKQKKGHWQPLAMSLEVLRGLRGRAARADSLKEAIDALIVLLEPEKGESGRLRRAVGDTLRNLCEKPDMDDDWTAWKEWWAVKRDAYAPRDLAAPPGNGGDGPSPRRPRGKKGEEEKKGGDPAPAPAPAPDPATPVGTAVRFHGIQIVSDRVAFVLDYSGSMDNKIPVPPPEEPPPSGPPGSGEREKKPKGGAATGGEEKKTILSKEELLRCVRALPEDIWFNVFAYGDDVVAWEKSLVPASKAAKAAVEAFLAKLKLGRTNYLAALTRPLEDPSCDTVYFLTDGGIATDGRYLDHDRIIKKVLEINRYAMVEFNCILFGSPEDTAKDSNRRWLEQLCAPSGGKLYVKPEYK
jgi:HEAT repeat protein